VRSGALSSVAWNAWLGLLSFSVQIEIAIGIGIKIACSLLAIECMILPNLVSSSAQSVEHRRHAVEFVFAAPALGLVQRLADNQNILNGGAF